MIKENLSVVEQNIQNACLRASRLREEVTLIAVSKTKPVSMIEEVMAEGIVDFGENKVQELTTKYEILPKDLRWHLIGHLQTNKVKYIVDKAVLIHSVDSYKLAEQIDKEAAKKGIICDILIEVNVAGEDTKFGVSAEEVYPLILEIAQLKNLRIKGLMTIAPFVDNPEKNREHFRNLRQLKVDIKLKNIDNVSMDELSMGMTGDYEVAIEEGATMVRVGTGIFGEREYMI
ncbi:YggS family pyridoxal phosphate-dependent enzyme [Anaerocolumna sp. AGMB13025]|uniref:YggS family pyridoxal phosphate-dependent enzyme n=1 Tax=Anaerocolumna sp. AGMB13025 TaxID=3039116 RepID=UPI00241FB9FB|nr:YggS family pyridoxal phosphate-dependent enzyme [Anaerocolumna sp. AGMB13025]WFR54747.1 YggS family pyridoxal phosphate-dependent enzyme [Anaerocolumna sp. AGMB13025]